jgi:hypothetical protein
MQLSRAVVLIQTLTGSVQGHPPQSKQHGLAQWPAAHVSTARILCGPSNAEHILSIWVPFCPTDSPELLVRHSKHPLQVGSMAVVVQPAATKKPQNNTHAQPAMVSSGAGTSTLLTASVQYHHPAGTLLMNCCMFHRIALVELKLRRVHATLLLDVLDELLHVLQQCRNLQHCLPQSLH